MPSFSYGKGIMKILWTSANRGFGYVLIMMLGVWFIWLCFKGFNITIRRKMKITLDCLINLMEGTTTFSE